MNRKEKRAAQFSKNHLELQRIKPLTDNQALMLNAPEHIVAHGSAGTGKTILAMYLAFKDIESDNYSTAYLIRSAVPTRDMGFLPGTDKAKAQVYESPYSDNTAKLFGRSDAYDILKQKKTVHFITTSFIRGTTFDDCVVIVDECQNMTYQELDSIITRIGQNCRVIFCGDWMQSDLKGNGIVDFYRVLKNMEEFTFIEFGLDDIVRSDLVKNYLITKHELLGEPGEGRSK